MEAFLFFGNIFRKFLSKNFRETLLGLKNLSLENQKVRLNSILEDWKGDIDQIDDITVMGIKI